MTLERLLLGIGLATLLSACDSLGLQEREPESSAAVEAQMSVKSALVADDRVAAAPIRVEYREGEVLLQGFVADEEERRLAEEIARETVPDLTIINELQTAGR